MLVEECLEASPPVALILVLNFHFCGKMDTLWLNQFAILLWKNFILKKRKMGSLIVEISMTVLFCTLILLLRKHSKREFTQATLFQSLPLNKLPTFLTNKKKEYELVYVPSGSDAAKNITEKVKDDLNANLTG
ncbi:putative uncharacterized protein CRYM-AS1 [Bubalus kerabau]|uniref:putative uncharacterized protein CRYM-AS1 n=1 Tax=Bubalus carabanensis TaxID=3119969 RepID=UPI00244EA800|nr:putative uncharacterized protein CRYM-AS1 [Bubalus carabanensis]